MTAPLHSTFERRTGESLQNTEPYIRYFDPVTGSPLSQSLVSVGQQPMPPTSTFDSARQDMAPAIEAAATRLRLLLERISSLENLRLNWDSYGSEPPSISAIENVRNLVWVIVAQHFGSTGETSIPYTVVPLSGGGIQAEWRGATDSIEVEIGRNCDYAYLLTRGQGAGTESEERESVSENEVFRLIASVIA